MIYILATFGLHFQWCVGIAHELMGYAALVQGRYL